MSNQKLSFGARKKINQSDCEKVIDNARSFLAFTFCNEIPSIFLNIVVKNRFPLVYCGVDSYLPLFTSSHGQNVVDSRGAAVTVLNCGDVEVYTYLCTTTI